METLVKIKVGSHLYGTETPGSDLDIKGIFIPQASDILLQKIPPVVVETRTKKVGQKNTAEDIDCEFYSPTKYFSLLVQGQTIALEMLFAPESALLSDPHPAWYEIKGFAPRLLTKKAASFVHYCQQQALKYSIKGSKIAVVRRVLEVLKELEARYGVTAPLVRGIEALRELVKLSGV